jgi:hypothetical protein
MVITGPIGSPAECSLELAHGSTVDTVSMATLIIATILATAMQGLCRIAEREHSITSTGMKRETVRAT